MKLRISYFKKDIIRFAPSWALYLIGMLLIMVGIFTPLASDARSLAADMNVTVSMLSVLNLGYALLNAQLLFGDLFNSRMCNALHALPIRREGWFLTHVVSGILFSLIPNFVVGLCLMPRLDGYFVVGLIWAGCLTLQYLFFFATAVFSAMCTGNRFAMLLVYGIINFLSLIVLWIVSYLYGPLMPGISMNADPFLFLSPVCQIIRQEYRYIPAEILPTYYYCQTNGIPYLLGIGGTGLVILAISLVLYRRRHLESAGSFITVKAVSPVFLLLYTLVAGIVLHMFAMLFGDERNYLFPAVGIAIGYITCLMLLKRTLKVFRPRNFIGLGLIAVLLFGSLGLAKLDVLGLVRWLPASEQVRSVSIGSDNGSYTTDDPAEIRELVDLHSAILGELDNDYGYYTSINLQYTMADGKTVNRSYRFSTLGGDTLEKLKAFLSKPEMVLGYSDWDSFRSSIVSVSVVKSDEYIFDNEDARSLTDAIKADCDAGLMNQDWSVHTDTDYYTMVEIYLRGKTAADNLYRCVTVWDNCVNTRTWFENRGISVFDN